MMIVHLKKIEFRANIFIVYKMRANCTRHLEAIARNGQKVGVQLWFDIREVCLIRIDYNNYITTDSDHQFA